MKIPAADPNEYSEEECASAIKGLLNMIGVEWYSTEVGALVTYDEQGNYKQRRGGTRTTPGVPDLFAYLDEPKRELLTVEFKGATTQVGEAQWRFALNRARRGEPHLIVRSPEAFLWGLAYLVCLPRAWWERPPAFGTKRSWEDVTALPVNVNYLPLTVAERGDEAKPVPRNRMRMPEVEKLRRLGPNSPLR